MVEMILSSTPFMQMGKLSREGGNDHAIKEYNFGVYIESNEAGVSPQIYARFSYPKSPESWSRS